LSSGCCDVGSVLATLGRQIAWRRHAEQVVAELADHLHNATDRLVSAGVDPLSAQHRVLEPCSYPDAVAVAATSHGRCAGVAAGSW
jgi:hypothetical protein